MLKTNIIILFKKYYSDYYKKFLVSIVPVDTSLDDFYFVFVKTSAIINIFIVGNIHLLFLILLNYFILIKYYYFIFLVDLFVYFALEIYNHKLFKHFNKEDIHNLARKYQNIYKKNFRYLAFILCKLFLILIILIIFYFHFIL